MAKEGGGTVRGAVPARANLKSPSPCVQPKELVHCPRTPCVAELGDSPCTPPPSLWLRPLVAVNRHTDIQVGQQLPSKSNRCCTTEDQLARRDSPWVHSTKRCASVPAASLERYLGVTVLVATQLSTVFRAVQQMDDTQFMAVHNPSPFTHAWAKH